MNYVSHCNFTHSLVYLLFEGLVKLVEEIKLFIPLDIESIDFTSNPIVLCEQHLFPNAIK